MSSSPPASFSALYFCYEREKQVQQERQEKKKIKIKPKVNPHHLSPEKSTSEKQETPKKKKIIILVKRECRQISHNDIAPAATIYCRPKNDLYSTPPPQCCRFFIENKNCFLRQRDNACICPTSRIVIGFWNEKVGKECKLLPVESETIYEEENEQLSQTHIVPSLPPQSSPQSQYSFTSIIKSKSNSPKSPKKIDFIPKFVSDAQRSRIASEPVALLREKLAIQYGITKKTKPCHVFSFTQL